MFFIGILANSTLFLRETELTKLIKIGFYKNVEELSDKEVFDEYDLLR